MSILQTVINLLFISSYGVYCSDLEFAFPKNMLPSKLRVVGGTIVSPPNSYPSQALLRVESTTDTGWCGGSLIKPDWILTAAHCVEGNVKRIKVQLGLHDMSKYYEETRQVFITKMFAIHPGWDQIENDIALIKLPREAELNKNVNIITPVTGNDTFSSKVAIAIGWGLTELGVKSSQLKSVNLNILSNEECKAQHPAYSIITDKHLCTSGEGLIGMCSGDSGGPLIVEKHLVGIVSFGPTNCTSGLPTVFTRITKYLNWINGRMERGLNKSPNLRFNNMLAILTMLLFRFTN